MVLLKAEITVLKAMCGVYVGSLFLSAPTPLLDLTRSIKIYIAASKKSDF